jgi:cobalt-zinc-cadmium efflux system protein
MPDIKKHSSHHHSSHDHTHTHDHAPEVNDDSERRVFWVMCLTGSFMVLQIIGGLFSGSLALIADSGHMLSDTAALGLAWFGFRLSKRPADQRRSYGYDRFQILAAFTNGLTLFFIAAWMTFEAVDRLLNPAPILSGPMLAVAVTGLLVNIGGFWILHKGDTQNVNMQGALLHVLGDLLGSVAAIGAALMIMFTGWFAADPLLSILVAVIILKSGYGIVKKSGHILLEGTPEHLNLNTISNSISQKFPDVIDTHHVHAWSLTAEKTVLTLHVRITETADMTALLRDINRHDGRFDPIAFPQGPEERMTIHRKGGLLLCSSSIVCPRFIWNISGKTGLIF